MGAFAGPEIVENDLLLHLDAGNPKSYPGSGITWTDLSGNGDNGTITSGIATLTPTYSSSNGGSIQFYGANERVETSIQTYGNNTTWEAWVNRTSSVNAYNMFMGRFLPYFGVRPSGIIFSNNIGGSQRTISSTGFTPSNNTWYYLTFTTEYDGVNTTPKIYINGTLNNSGSFAGSQGPYEYKFTVGDGYDSPTSWYPFNGKVANVKIYNRALTAQEIQQNFNALRGRFGI
jgi:hypothetical protein